MKIMGTRDGSGGEGKEKERKLRNDQEVRKEKYRKRKNTGAVIIGVLLFGIWMAMASFAAEDGLEESELYAQSAVLMDGKSGRILWQKNGDVMRPMASTTKIMTCILALELGLGERDSVTEISSLAASQPQVHLGMQAGQKFYTRDILYSLMLESHNDSAVAIAEAAAGSVPEFARKMNEKAQELGCKGTWFITPNGLDGKETTEDGKEHIHSTTAKDLARIMRYCILESPKAQEFLEITRTAAYHFQDAGGKGSYDCQNHNALLTMMDGALSGKTGFTGGAGYCYVGAVEDQGRTFIVSILGCGWPPHKTYKWSDVRALINYGKTEYAYRDIYRECALPQLPVRDGIEEREGRVNWENCSVSLAMEDETKKSLPVLLGASDTVRVIRNLPGELSAPVEKGARVGSVDYYLNEQKIASFPIVTAEAVNRFSLEWCMQWVGKRWLSAVGEQTSNQPRLYLR